MNYYKNTPVFIKGEVIEIPRRFLINFETRHVFYSGTSADSVFYYGLRSNSPNFNEVVKRFTESNAVKLDCEGDWWEIKEPEREVLIYDNETYFYMVGPNFQDLLESYSKEFCKKPDYIDF